MLESPKKLLHQQIIFHDEYNSVSTYWDKIQPLRINYLAFMKSVGKIQEFLSNLKGRHSNMKLAVEYPHHNHLPSLNCNVTI